MDDSKGEGRSVASATVGTGSGVVTPGAPAVEGVAGGVGSVTTDPAGVLGIVAAGIVAAGAGAARALRGVALDGARAVLRLPGSLTRLGASVAPPAATVADVMQRTVATIAPETRLGEAWTLMQRRRIRHLPVVGPGGRLCGLLTHRDVLAALPSSLGTDTAAAALVAFGWAEARDLMATRLETVRAAEPARAAGRRMAGRKIGCLPVVGAQGELVGILTESDFLRWATEHM